MTDTNELQALIHRVRQRGAVVGVAMDDEALGNEGRSIIATVHVTGLPGCGPHPMCALSAAERLREALLTTACRHPQRAQRLSRTDDEGGTTTVCTECWTDRRTGVPIRPNA